MKNFNISRQASSSPQAWKKEYIQRLQQEFNSLYYYLHYYNPSWKLITNSQGYVGYTPYGSKDVYQADILNTEGTPSAPTSKGIYRQALAFRWGVKNTTGSPQYINYAEYGTYKRLNPGATLFKIDASDSADWIHYMIFEGALAQYYTQSYSFNYNSSTSKMDVTITNHLINAATKGLSYPIQFTRVPPRYFYQGLSLIPLKYLNNGAVVDKIYDNNNRITNDGQTIIQQWGENSDVCMDVFANHQGENLCVAADVSERVINGVTWRVEDQIYYLNGTPTDGSWQHPGQPIVHLEPGTYTVYYYTNSTDPEIYTHIGYGLCDRTNPDVNMWYWLNNEKMRTFTISTAMDCYIILWWGPHTLPEGKTFDNVWVRTAVYKGAPGYEPLFADTMIATSNSSTQQFKSYLDKTQAERKPVEDFFKTIIY